jgi:hypothetical protein
VKPSLISFCVLALVLLGCARTVSGLAHLHAIQGVTEPSAAVAAAACTEAMAAMDDFWPALPMLNVGRVIPLASARAWGHVPLIVDAARDACPGVEVYANIAPWPDVSIGQGAAADLLGDVRRQRARLTSANEQLTRAWTELDAVDVQALGADPRLARPARLIGEAQDQAADASDFLALAAPDRLERLLGGQGSRAIVLSVVNGDATAQAYAQFDDGRAADIATGEPSVPATLVISVDHATLAEVIAKLKRLQVPTGAADTEVARQVLTELVRVPLSDVQDVAAILKREADRQRAWFWSDDPVLQVLVTRHGWVRQ